MNLRVRGFANFKILEMTPEEETEKTYTMHKTKSYKELLQMFLERYQQRHVRPFTRHTLIYFMFGQQNTSSHRYKITTRY